MSCLKRIFFRQKAAVKGINHDFYFKIGQMSNSEVLSYFNSSPSGLRENKIDEIRKIHGPNHSDESQNFKTLKQFLDSAINPFNFLLAILSAIIYYQGDNVGGSIVIGMVVLSIFTTFIQEYRSSNAVEKLQKMINSTIDVYRLIQEDRRSKYRSFSFIDESVPHFIKFSLEDGEYKQVKNELSKNTGIVDMSKDMIDLEIGHSESNSHVVPLLTKKKNAKNSFLVFKCARMTVKVKDLVVGDIVCLSSGDVIPADIKLLESKFLFVNQSAMNGESMPSEKHSNKKPDEGTDLYDYSNLVFQGTSVVSGTGRGIVFSTGKNTLFGHIKSSISKKRQRTSFDRGIDYFVIMMVCFMVFLCLITLFVNGFSKSLGWGEALQFSLAIAVGLTPQMLPMIISGNLAKGAITMSKKKVIIKRLVSIQNIGAMNILCTDKTGTLTDDHIVLEQSIDVLGNPAFLPLKYAYFISYFQTGLRNLLDDAVIKKAEMNLELRDMIDNIEKIDEIPFDFERRRMSVIIKEKDSEVLNLLCKGAAEETLNSCIDYLDFEGNKVPLNEFNKEDIIQVFHGLNMKGLRVIGVALRELGANKQDVFDVSKETQMTLVGFLTFLDPPKKSTVETIKKLNKRGIIIKVITGDNEFVARYVCQQAGIDVTNVVTGQKMRYMNDEELNDAVETGSVFAKMTPQQKELIVKTLQNKKNVVGFMGDGINDSLALKVADCSISVDNAMDITKQCADIILLEKSLEVLDNAVVEGRTVFGNIVKYIKMGSSSNFGNVFSMTGASFLFPFLPMSPIQVLIQGILYDLSQCGIPFDKVDPEYLETPKKWEIKDIAKFMVIIGPISSIFDYLTWGLMWWFYGNHGENDNLVTQFQTVWFIEGFFTQALIVHVIRTHKLPFISSVASKTLIASTLTSMALAILFIYIPLADYIPFIPPNPTFYGFLALFLFGYCLLTQIGKYFYYMYYGLK